MVRRFLVIPVQDDKVRLVPKEASASNARWWKKTKIRLPSGREAMTKNTPAGAEELTASEIAATDGSSTVAAEDSVQPAVAPAHDEVTSLGPLEPSAAKTRKKSRWWREAKLPSPSGRATSKCTPAGTENITASDVVATEDRVVTVQPAVVPAHDEVTSLVRRQEPSDGARVRAERTIRIKIQRV